MSEAKRSDGLVMRAISNGWIEFLLNIAWSVGNGRSIDIFKDVWIPSLGHLYRYLLDPAIASKGLTFTNLVTADGNWDISTLYTLFSNSTLTHILSVKCHGPDDGDDQCM
ncbi:hypothetical protein V6N12_010635 [Hibiscus sabdariffa]|uniref:Uncharacterized protein n=1 Tax=Hibiscus sabdariffa TaxID=183260 RepID=A0ABR2EKN9_9ROSI